MQYVTTLGIALLISFMYHQMRTNCPSASSHYFVSLQVKYYHVRPVVSRDSSGKSRGDTGTWERNLASRYLAQWPANTSEVMHFAGTAAINLNHVIQSEDY